jgi:phenylacetate-CoA ligase
VPGYRILYREAGIHPNDLNILSDIQYFPFITKETIRDNLADFTAKNIIKHKLHYVATSGSSGIPFGFYIIKSILSIENAFLHSSWERILWTLEDQTAILQGRFIGSKKHIYDYNALKRTLSLSSYHLTENSYEKYVNIILKYKLKYIRAYPSTITQLAHLVLSNSDSGRLNLQGILFSSENIYDWQKQRILAAFPGVRIFGVYGHMEKVIMAAMCEHSDHYHVWPFYGYTEVLNQQDQEVSTGDVGELVGTSFWNDATPFIRYRTMDTARKGQFGDPTCGRQFQILTSIEGRMQDTLISATGQSIPVPTTSIHSDIFDNVKQFQFYQDTPGHVLFKIVRKNSYINQDTEKIYSNLKQKLGVDIHLDIIFLKEIPKTPGGKTRFVDQKLKIAHSHQEI